MTRLPIRTRLTLAYIAVLGVAMVLLTGAAWWLMRMSLHHAADTSLRDRVDGTRRFIVAAQHGLPKEELQDEFQEFAELTHGEALLEVTDDMGKTLCRSSLAGWDALQVPASPSTGLQVVASEIAGKPYRAIATTLDIEGHSYKLKAAVPLATQYAALAQFGWLLAGLVPAVMMLAAAGGFWLSRRALAPVDRMTRDVRQISVTDPGRRVDVPPADDELRRLAETFNDMLARWQRAFADMARFTADASHELRTPVTLARTTAELALTKPRSSEDYRAALADVLTYTERMTQLVEDLLLLARADAGMEAQPNAPVELGEVSRDAMKELQPAADRAGLAIESLLPAEPLTVAGSAASLRRLLVILLDNAVRYTPAPGAIRLRVSRAVNGHGPEALIEVVDTGPGIDPADRPRVFDRFYRGAPARQAAPDGAGLGLAIARTIVDRHHGTIAVSTPSSGQGCKVDVSLPLTT